MPKLLPCHHISSQIYHIYRTKHFTSTKSRPPLRESSFNTRSGKRGANKVPSIRRNFINPALLLESVRRHRSILSFCNFHDKDTVVPHFDTSLQNHDQPLGSCYFACSPLPNTIDRHHRAGGLWSIFSSTRHRAEPTS
jgi:hypothetical protein